MGATAPVGQKPPAEQTTHAVRPLAPWYLPASQAVHSAKRLVGATLPAAHGVGTVEPAGQKDPAVQLSQSDCAALPELAE